MKSRFVALGLAVAVGASFSCASAPSIPEGPSPTPVKSETLFTEPEHEAPWCQKEALDHFRTLPDGVLFFDADSRIRLCVPSDPGQIPYHAHLFFREGAELAERWFPQGPNGRMEIDLSRFPEPEFLLLTSATARLRVQDPQTSERQLPLLAPYAMAFRMVPREQADLYAGVQPFRYEWKHPAATVQLFAQSFNRNDMLLTLLDSQKGAEYLFADGAFHWKGGDALLVPRATVEVASGSGQVWQRSATYPIPDPVWEEGSASLALTLMGLEVLPFAPPPRVDLALLDEKPATSFRIGARFQESGVERRRHLVLLGGTPVDGRERVALRIQTAELPSEMGEATYLMDFSDLEPSRFPVTGYLAHRVVEPWRAPGGFHRACAPLGTAEARVLVGGGSPSRVVAPVFASHFALVTLLGKGGMESELPTFLGTYLTPRTTARGPIFAVPVPVPWPPIVPVPTLPVFPAVPVATPVPHFAVPVTVTVLPATPLPTAVIAALSPHLDATSADVGSLGEGTVVAWTERGLESVTVNVTTGPRSSVTLPEGLRPATLSFQDPNLANRIAQAAGTDGIFTGRAVVAPLRVLWHRANVEWRAAYETGIEREQTGRRPIADRTGFDFWPGYRPPQVSAAGRK